MLTRLRKMTLPEIALGYGVFVAITATPALITVDGWVPWLHRSIVALSEDRAKLLATLGLKSWLAFGLLLIVLSLAAVVVPAFRRRALRTPVSEPNDQHRGPTDSS